MRDSLKNKSVLTYSFADDNGRIEVRWDGFDAIERRHTYHYRIETGPDSLSQVSYETDDLRSGSDHPVSLPRALAGLLGFLSAFSEARREGDRGSENWSLFPDHLSAWAEAMLDEFTFAEEEIEPEPERYR